jgi:hypothetical protein
MTQRYELFLYTNKKINSTISTFITLFRHFVSYITNNLSFIRRHFFAFFEGKNRGCYILILEANCLLLVFYVKKLCAFCDGGVQSYSTKKLQDKSKGKRNKPNKMAQQLGNFMYPMPHQTHKITFSFH